MRKEKTKRYDYVRLGRRIQARRKEIGLTQEELAEKIDCSLTHLSRLESGSPPGLDTLIRLSFLLGYSLDEMLGLYPSPNPYVHEICDLFLVHSESDQKHALWMLQYFFYIIDLKEQEFKNRKRRQKQPAETNPFTPLYHTFHEEPSLKAAEEVVADPLN